MTLAKPERRNAFDAELIAELHEGVQGRRRCARRPARRRGGGFCAGADIEWQRSAIDLSFDENVDDAMRLFAMMQAIDGCPAPVVARIQGYALGGGSGLAAAVDIAIASEDAVFCSEVKLGIVPAVISPFVLPKIGEGAARRLLTGERFDAQAALQSDWSARWPTTSTALSTGSSVSSHVGPAGGTRGKAPGPHPAAGRGDGAVGSANARERRGAGRLARLPGATQGRLAGLTLRCGGSCCSSAASSSSTRCSSRR